MNKETNIEELSDKLIMFFPFFYKKAMKIWHKSLGDKLPNQYHMTLGIVMKQGPIPMTELGNMLCTSKPNTTFIINKLIEEGKLERLPDKEDRRIINITITEKGKKYLLQNKEKARENLKISLAKLSKQELTTLYESIENLNSILSKIGEE